MAAVVSQSQDLKKMTSQPTITLSSPAQSSKPASQTASSKLTVPSSLSTSSNHATAKPSSLGSTMPSTTSAHQPPARSQSIPSSPTSIHSSSSAIFERDIEPIGFQSSPLKANDPHHTSRAQVHEPVEQSVPSVLTSAVSVLSLAAPALPSASGSSPSTPASPSATNYKRRSIYDPAGDLGSGEVSVIAPATSSSTAPNIAGFGSPSRGASLLLSGMATPRSMSRSPSPPVPATARPPSMISDSAAGPSSTTTHSASPRLIGGNELSTNSAVAVPASSSPPSSFNAAGLPLSTGTSPTSTSDPVETPSSLGLAGFVVGSSPIPRTRPSASQASLSLSTGQGGMSSSPPTGIDDTFGGFAADDALSASGPNHRLSFISYHDLLVSTPLSSAPLSSITSGASQPTQSQTVVPASPGETTTFAGSPGSGKSSPPRGRSNAPPAHATVVGWGKEDGGEWEREGLGKGLEERLEEMLAAEAKTHQIQEKEKNGIIVESA